MTQSLLWAAGGTGFTFLMTSLGAAVVFFFSQAGDGLGPTDLSGIRRRGDDRRIGLVSAYPRH